MIVFYRSVQICFFHNKTLYLERSSNRRGYNRKPPGTSSFGMGSCLLSAQDVVSLFSVSLAMAMAALNFARSAHFRHSPPV